MSKNIKLNETEYNGVSTVQLPTTSGGTATFKDTDEITTPSGNTTITENGTFDVTEFAKAIVNVISSGGSDTSGLESGTFEGDGTNIATIPVTSKKTHLIIFGDGILAEDYDSTPYANHSLFAISGRGISEIYIGYSGTAMSGGFKEESAYIEYEGNSSWTGSYCYFKDESIDLRTKISGSSNQFFHEGMTYNWLAW